MSEKKAGTMAVLNTQQVDLGPIGELLVVMCQNQVMATLFQNHTDHRVLISAYAPSEGAEAAVQGLSGMTTRMPCGVLTEEELNEMCTLLTETAVAKAVELGWGNYIAGKDLPEGSNAHYGGMVPMDEIIIS